MNELEDIVGMQMWSFICGNQTVFDQSSLTCNHVTDAFPCEESEALFNRFRFETIWISYPAKKENLKRFHIHMGATALY